MPKRLVRSFELNRRFTSPTSKNVRIDYFNPEIRHEPFDDHGLDTEIRMGKTDSNKLGEPKRIKVVIYSLDN